MKLFPKVYHLIIVFFLLFTYAVQAESGKVDSLLSTLPSTQDTSFVNQLIDLLTEEEDREVMNALAEKALSVSKSINYKEGIARSVFRVGESFRLRERYEDALPFYEEALQKSLKLSDKSISLYVFKGKSLALRQLGKTKEAFQCLIDGLQLADELENSRFQAKYLFELGDFYRLQRNFDEAIENFEKVRAMINSGQAEGNMCRLLFYISITYKHYDDIEKRRLGIQALEEILSGDCNKELSEFNRAVTLSNLGSAYVNIEEFEKGEEVLMEALKVKRKINAPISLAYTLNELAMLYLDSKQYQKGLAFGNEAYSLLGSDNTDIYLEHDITRNMAHLNHGAKQYDKAYDFLNKFQTVKDTILNNEKASALAEMSSKYELGKKEKDLLQKDLLIVKQNSKLNQYILIGLAILIFGLGLFFWQRWKLQKQHIEAKKLQELDELKSNFFTNITHEFRTPLTIILNSLSGKIVKDSTVELSSKEAGILQRNANRLNMLINQLLDLSKLEAGKMRLQIRENDLCVFLKTLTQSFDSLALQKEIQLQFASQLIDCKMYFDVDKVEKMISNLLTNAIKFTPVGGEVNVLLLPKGSKVEIIVKDNGPGISPEALPYIFDRFQQADDSATRSFEGSGIGLALAQQMAKVHHGAIKVESTLGMGSIFTISLPAHKKSYSSDEIAQTPFIKLAQTKRSLVLPVEQEITHEAQNTNLPLVLIIEDDPDLRYLLKQQLQENYQIAEAENGLIGVEMAVNQIPDLVISDVMMPELSGYEVCQKLKDDDRTNHIPIILLTAKATQEEKIEGLELGADTYLIKPFDRKELDVRVQNLITQRKSLQQRYAGDIIYRTKESPVVSRQDAFMQKVLEIIEQEIANENFGVEELASAVHMSRSQLYRKLKALTDKTPNVFIREIRLNRAKILLESEAGNVSEIAGMVGFASSNYFYKSFKEKFNSTPGEVLKKGNATKSHNSTT